jgi:transcription termination/antitermination protein NusA
MNHEILDALSQITREKSVDRAMLIETLEVGLASAVRRKYGATAEVEVRFSNESGAITIALRKTVVESVEDAALQLTVEEARVFPQGRSASVGDVLTFPLRIEEFGRNAIQTAKQVLIQRVREAERDRVFREYSDKIGVLVRGVVQQVDRGNVIVKLDHSEGFLPAREQIPRSYHRQGDYVRAVVINVDKSAKGPQVILSRTHPDFLRRLFEAEVPEIAESIVEIKAVAREAGARSKISVYSTDPRVDAVGSCVGMKGSRVQSIVRELGGERIDIVPWSQDPSVFVSRALSPARVMDVRVVEVEKRMNVIVADDQLSLAIGKGGQNARLAARLTGWKIDLVAKSEEKKRQDLARASRVEVEKLSLGEATTQKLISAGIETVQELVDAPIEKLTEIPGIGEKTAEKLLTAAQEYLAAHPPVLPEAAPGELEFTPEMEATPEADAVGPGAPLETAAPAAAPAESGTSADAPDPGTPGEAPGVVPATPNEGEDRAD